MSDDRLVRGFEEALRPPVDVRRARLTPAVLGGQGRGGLEAVKARIVRVARGAPEVMVKITGRTRDGGHLKAHLDYISRNGGLALEGPDGERVEGRGGVGGLAREWADELAMEPRRRRDASLSLSVILSMPAGVDAGRVRDAARVFAAEIFGERFPYVFVLHDEGRHPHVHLTVRALGQDGERLNPRKADLQLWRERFAAALRAREVEAEATPRRLRGVTRKAERTPVRKMRERFEAGMGTAPRVLVAAVRRARAEPPEASPWSEVIQRRDRAIRRALMAATLGWARDEGHGDPASAELLARFVRTRPPPETRDEMLRRRIREREGGDERPRER